MSNADLRIDRARWWALTNQPFYGALAMSLPDVFDRSIETAATDGSKILWNAAYVETLSDEEIRFVLLHETLHCAHQHMWRLPTDQRGNIAGDHEINLLLKGLAGVSMPDGGLADPQYRGMACEDILGALPEEQPQDQPQGDQGDQGDDGASDPCGTFTAPADPDGTGDPQAAAQASQDLRDAWETRVMQAAQAAQALGVGEIPGDMQRILDKVRHQAIDWRREMADFVRDAMSTRNDWSRSSRRHAWQPVIYPRKRVDDIGTVIFARDTSGSVDDRTAAQYSALITDCVSELGCAGLVIDCDRVIQAEYHVNGFESCPLTAKGGGGTDFRPVFNRADEMLAAGEHIAGVVYLTDLMGPMPDSSDIPTLWLATSDRAASFGRTVRIEA
jgi:predicted metal-dependent peptidase